MLLWAVLVLLYRGADRQRTGPLLLLVFAAGITIVADSVYSLQAILETYTSAGLLDISWIITSLLYGIAGVWQATGKMPVMRPVPRASALRLDTWITYLPSACAIGAYLMLEYNHSEELGSAWLTWEIGFIILVLLRQIVTLQENHRQAQTLGQVNHALQEEISERQQAGEQVQGGMFLGRPQHARPPSYP